MAQTPLPTSFPASAALHSPPGKEKEGPLMQGTDGEPTVYLGGPGIAREKS